MRFCNKSFFMLLFETLYHPVHQTLFPPEEEIRCVDDN